MSGWAGVFHRSATPDGDEAVGWEGLFHADGASAAGHSSTSSTSPASGWARLFNEPASEEEEEEEEEEEKEDIFGELASASEGSALVAFAAAADGPPTMVGHEGVVDVYSVPEFLQARAAELAPLPDISEKLCRAELEGLLREPAGHDHLGAAAQICSMQAEVLAKKHVGKLGFIDHEVVELCETLIESGCLRTDEATAETECIDVRKVRSTRWRIACCVWHSSRRLVVRVIREIVDCVTRSGGRAVTLTEKIRLDESPFSLRTASQNDAIPGAVSSWFSKAMSHDPAEVCKLIQVESTVAVLVQLPSGTYCLLRLQVPSALQCVDRCTAAALKQCMINERLKLDGVGKRCVRHQRLCISDGDGAMAKADWSLSNDASTDALRMICDVHRMASIAVRTAKSIESDVSAWIHIGLSLKVGGGFAKFKAILRDVLTKRLKILRGSAGVTAAAHRERTLDLFCPAVKSRPSTLVRRAIVQRVANGDFTKTDVFHHYLLPGESEEQAIASVLGPFVDAACAGGVHVFARHRWNNADRTLEGIGLLMAVHGLLPAVFKLWCRDIAGADPGPRLGADGLLFHAIGDGIADAGEAGHDAAGGGDACGVAADAIDNQRQRQANYKSSGLAYLGDHEAHVRLIIFKRVLDCQQRLVYAALRRSGVTHEAVQSSKVAMSALEGRPYTPEHRAMLAAKTTLEQRFMKDISALMSSSAAWSVVGPEGCRASFVSLAFQMCSTAAAACHELLITPHRNYPLKAFLGVESVDALAQFQREKECRLDPWSKAFRGHWGDVQSADAIADLASTMLLLHTDNVGIEENWAAIRRRCVVKSVGTHSATLQDASADFLVAQARLACGRQRLAAAKTGAATQAKRRMRRARKQQKRQRRQDADARQEVRQPSDCRGRAKGAASGRKRRAPNGGGLRAYISKRCKYGHRGRIDFGAMARDYNDLPDDERDEVREAGQEALRRHKDGVARPFGTPASTAERHAAVQRRKDQRQALVDDATKRLTEDSGGGASSAVQLFEPKQYLSRVAQVSFSEMMALTMEEVRKVRVEQAVFEAACERVAGDLNGTGRLGDRALAPLRQAGALPAGVAARDFSVVGTGHANLEMLDVHIDALGASKSCVSMQARTKIGAMMASALDASWMEMHKMVMDSKCGAIHGKRQPSPCHDSGFCLCSSSGARVERFVRSAYAAVKSRFKAGAADTTSLIEHHVVVMFDGKPLCGEVPGPPQATSSTDAVPARPALIWLHVALLYRKPYRITWQRLAGPTSFGESDTQAQLRATHEWLTMYEFAFSIDLGMQWTVRFFELDRSGNFVSEFLPNSIRVECIGPRPGVMVWTGQDKPPGVRAPWRGRRGDQEGGVQPIGDGDDEEPEDPDDVQMHDDIEDALEGLLLDDWVLNMDVPEVAGGAAEEAAPSGDAQELAIVAVAADVAPARPAASCKRRQEAAATIYVPGGAVSYYEKGERFYGYCEAPEHINCRMERTSKAGRRPGQGRPLGLIIAWLGSADRYSSQQEHLLAGRWQTLDDRTAGRRLLEGLPGADALLSREAGYNDGVREEPAEMC